MFIDMVGYTGIVAADETRASEARATLRTLLADILPARGGTLVQSFGDGSLIVFSSAASARRPSRPPRRVPANSSPSRPAL